MVKRICKLMSLGLIGLLGACASNSIPPAIREAPQRPTLKVEQVQQAPKSYRGESVRWGGEILAVHNHQEATDVVLLRRDLFSDGEPKPRDGEAKRFVARIPQFLDPADYKPGQRMTVVGRLDGLEPLKVGDYDYAHPLVLVDQFHRWGAYVEPQVPPWHTDPFFCDPLFGPWGYRRYGGFGCW